MVEIHHLTARQHVYTYDSNFCNGSIFLNPDRKNLFVGDGPIGIGENSDEGELPIKSLPRSRKFSIFHKQGMLVAYVQSNVAN